MIDFTPSISFDPTPPTPKTTWSHPFLHESSLEGTTWALRCPKIGVFKTLGHRLRHPVFSLGTPKHVVSALNLDRWWIVIGGLNSPAERPGKCRRAESRTNRAGSWQIRHRLHLVSQHPNMAGLLVPELVMFENRKPRSNRGVVPPKHQKAWFFVACQPNLRPSCSEQTIRNPRNISRSVVKTRDASWVQWNFTKKLPAIPESKSPGGLPAPSQWQLFETSTLVVPAPFLSWTSC